jgi:NADH-quinone oxidoreductase subunit M
MLYERRHTRMIDGYGGIARVMPLFGTFLMIATLSSIALPGTFGFVGEFLVLIGSFERYPITTFVATAGVVLGACYMLWAVQRILFNKLDKPENRHLSDLNWREAAMLVPLCAVIIWIGIYPAPFLRRMEPTLARLVQQVEAGAAAQAAAEPREAAETRAVTAAAAGAR